MSVDWSEVAALAQAFSGVAVAVSLLFVVYQLHGQKEEEFVSGSASMFDILVDDDFQRAIQWVLYDLHEDSWRKFVTAHRGKYGERAFIRVGAFFNRTGYLVTRRLLGGFDQVTLETVAPTAIAVWTKIQPLVLEARLLENSILFQDFERMLPECFECYVPGQPLSPATLSQISSNANQGERG